MKMVDDTGTYINNIPPVYIPHVQYELTKAARCKVYVDLDMANSFHQIPISEEFSQYLVFCTA